MSNAPNGTESDIKLWSGFVHRRLYLVTYSFCRRYVYDGMTIIAQNSLSSDQALKPKPLMTL